MQSGTVVPGVQETVNPTVMWAGKEWYVIGMPGKGVNSTSPTGSYTLLAKESFGDMEYRVGGSTSALGANYDAASGWYYNGTWSNGPTDYQNSTVQTYLSDWLSADSGASSLEQQLPIPRVLFTGDPAQNLWLLSSDEELTTINQSFIPLAYDSAYNPLDESWWTRSASDDTIHGSTKIILADPYGSQDSADYVHNQHAVRPASTLDLSKVVYTSVAEARRGKSVAQVGDGPTAVTSLPDANRLPVYKYTITSDALELSAAVKSDQPTTLSESIRFTYEDATTGGSHYLSYVIANGSGDVSYYGKLAALDANSTGEVTLNAAGLADGTYELRLYDEQASTQTTSLKVNGLVGDYEAYTDFVSDPVKFDLLVQGGKASVIPENAIYINYVADGKGSVDVPVEALAPDMGTPRGSTAFSDLGYHFVNWTDASNNVVSTDATFAPAKVGGLNVAGTYTAHFAPNNDTSYQVHYWQQNLAGDSYTEVTADKLDKAGTTDAPIDPSDLAKTYAGFTKKNETYTTSSSPDSTDTGVIASDGSLVVNVYYDRAIHSLNYNANGHGTAPASTKARVGSTVVEPVAPVAAGYDFGGWFTDPACTLSWNFATSTMPDTDVTVYAKWTEAANVTINYLADDNGSVSDSSENVAPISGTPAGSVATPDAYYHFLNWTDGAGRVVSTQANFTPVRGEDGAYVSATYTAHFAPTDQVCIVYGVLEGGTTDPFFELFDADGGIPEGSKATASTGYHFVNWTTFTGLEDPKVEVSTTPEFTPAKPSGGYVNSTYLANFAPNTYSATFKSNGGSGTMPAQPMTYNESVDLQQNTFTREGYTFAGWATSSGGPVVYADKASVMNLSESQGSAVDLYAVWTENDNVVLSYTAADSTTGSVTSGSESLAPATGTATGASATAQAGYHFVNWTNSKDATVTTDATLTTAQIDAVAKAGGIYEKVTFTANFAEDADATISYVAAANGTVSPVSENVAPATGTAAGSTAIPDVGYHLAEWADNQGHTVSTQATFAPARVAGTAYLAATYTANFEPNTYKVNFNGNGEGVTGSMDAQSMTYGTTAELTGNNFTREGYYFVGWSTDAAATTATYADEGAVSNLSTSQSDTVELFAVWAPQIHEVTFLMGDEPFGDPVEVAHDQTVENPSDTPALKGYDFAHWSLTPGGDAYDFLTPVTSDIELHAVMQARNYKIVFDPAGGYLPDTYASRTVNWTTDKLSSQIDSNYPTFGSKFFDGWYLGTTKLTATTTYADLAGGNDSLRSIVLSAHWLDAPRPTYSVSFDSAGGSAVASQKVTEGESPERPNNPVRNGYIFSEWYISGTEDAFSFDTPVYDKLTLEAHWTELGKYKVTYAATGDIPDGWTPPTIGKMHEGDVFLVDNTSMEGYVFDGWYVDDDHTMKYTKDALFTMPASDVTLTGVWSKAAPYAVSFDTRGGTTVASQSVATGQKATKPADPTRAGFVFKGWQLNGRDYDFASPVYENQLLVAQWERANSQKVTVSFDLAGGTGTTPSPQTVAIGSTISYPTGVFSRAGYDFLGWLKPDGSKFDFDSAVKSNMTLSAGWSARQYRVEYVTSGTAIAPSTVAWDSKALNTLLPKRDGFTFVGWTCEGAPVSAADTYATLAGNDEAKTTITLTAQWVANTGCTVFYDANGGVAVAGQTGLATTAEAYRGDKTGFADVTTTREGFRLTGWTYNGVDIPATATFASLAADGRTNITLVAQWKKTATLTFLANDFNGGLVDAATGTVQVVTTPADPSATTTTDAGQNVSVVIDADTADVITIRSFLSNAALAAGYQGALWTGPDGKYLDATQVPGHDCDWQFVVKPSEGGTYESGTYKTNFYTLEPFAEVKYSVEGAYPDSWTIPQEAIPYYTAGEKVFVPQVPSFDGWTFKGWKLAKDDSSETMLQPGAPYSISAQEADNWNVLNFQAVWQKDADPQMNVSFEVTGDVPAGWTAPAASTGLVPGSEFIVPKVSTRKGYSFDGWYLGTVRYEPGATIMLPTEGDAVFKGVWTKDADPVDPDDPDNPDEPNEPETPDSPTDLSDTDGSSSTASDDATGSLSSTGDDLGAATGVLALVLALATLVFVRTAPKRRE